VASGGKQRDSAQARQRARVYQARQTFHAEQSRRRTRDNLIAGIGGGVLILAVIGAQTAYFLAGPGAPVPSPSTSLSPTPATTPAPSQTPAQTPSPSPTATQ
jgi:hypothetical protein